ncbi:MAG: uracil-DNA glycosylase family protein [Candidatus Korobacteraceae bacterium]
MPAHPTLDSLRAAARDCRACDLWERETQTVFGEGKRTARVEQPGDKEDLEGKPFVGPAGALLDKALVEAGIDPLSRPLLLLCGNILDVYVTLQTE